MNDFSEENDETGGYSLDVLWRVWELWSKSQRFANRELPQVERRELEYLLEKYDSENQGGRIIYFAKKIYGRGDGT